MQAEESRASSIGEAASEGGSTDTPACKLRSERSLVISWKSFIDAIVMNFGLLRVC